MEVFMGTIMAVGFNYAPRGWAMCNGQLLSVAQNSALFSLLGIAYGGDGVTTFGLPDLRGRTAVGTGPGPGLTNVVQGQKWGSENTTAVVNGAVSVTIGAANLPKHTHPVTIEGNQLTATSTLNVTATTGGPTPAAGMTLGSGGTGGSGVANIYAASTIAPDIALNTASVTTKVDGQINTTSGQNDGTGAAINAPVTATGQIGLAQPSLGVNYIICIEGLYPTRN